LSCYTFTQKTITAKAMADATSINCNDERNYGNNDGKGTTAKVMVTTATATAMAGATVMATTKAATATSMMEM
jgi:hypothetical protein